MNLYTEVSLAFWGPKARIDLGAPPLPLHPTLTQPLVLTEYQQINTIKDFQLWNATELYINQAFKFTLRYFQYICICTPGKGITNREEENITASTYASGGWPLANYRFFDYPFTPPPPNTHTTPPFTVGGGPKQGAGALDTVLDVLIWWVGCACMHRQNVVHSIGLQFDKSYFTS